MQGTGSTMATSACLRRVVAPPGRLAITLRDGKAPWKGPYVFGLEADSPLISAVALGWRLIAVNDTSVHDFSCHAAARLLKFVDNSKDDRVLLFAAPPTNGPTISWYGSCGIALAMTALSIVVAAWFALLLPQHLAPLLGYRAAFVSTALGIVLLVKILVTFWRCVLEPPGYVATPAIGESACGDSCARCRIVKPARAHHCRHCDRCVQRMDHHCFWLGTCIGEHNYTLFLELLVSFGLGTTYGSVVILCVLLLRIGESGAAWPTPLRADSLVWPAALAAVLVVTLVNILRCLAMHVILISKGETTLEYLYPVPRGEHEHEPMQTHSRERATACWKEHFHESKSTSMHSAWLWRALLVAHSTSPLTRRSLQHAAIFQPRIGLELSEF